MAEKLRDTSLSSGDKFPLGVKTPLYHQNEKFFYNPNDKMECASCLYVGLTDDFHYNGGNLVNVNKTFYKCPKCTSFYIKYENGKFV